MLGRTQTVIPINLPFPIQGLQCCRQRACTCVGAALPDKYMFKNPGVLFVYLSFFGQVFFYLIIICIILRFSGFAINLPRNLKTTKWFNHIHPYSVSVFTSTVLPVLPHLFFQFLAGIILQWLPLWVPLKLKQWKCSTFSVHVFFFSYSNLTLPSVIFAPEKQPETTEQNHHNFLSKLNG